jgi:glutaredoxin 3
MNSENIPILYVKPGCPWCHEVTEFLDEHGISHREVNVMTDESGFAEMRRKSGQSRVPTLDWHGEILADFGVDELVPFLHKQQVELEES